MKSNWIGRLGLALALCAVFTIAVAAEPVSFADLARHMQYRTVRISPDGAHIAAVQSLPDGSTALVLINRKTQKGSSITLRGGDDVLGLWWASPKYLVYTVGQHLGGFDAPFSTGELYSIQADGGSPRMLYGYRLNHMQTGSLLNRATAELGSAEFLSRIRGDDEHILVTVTPWAGTKSSGASTEVFRMNVRDGNKQLVSDAPMREAMFLADHQGRVRFAFGDDLEGHHKVYMRPADGGAWELLQQPSEDRSSPLAFSADDRTVWFECPGSPAGFGICTFDPATRRMTSVWSNPRVEPTALAKGLAADSVIGVRFTDGRPAIALFDKDSPDAKVLAGFVQNFPGEDVRFVSGTDDGGQTIVQVQSDVDPGTFYLFDSTSHKALPLAHRAKWIKPDELGRVVPFTFQTRDGLTEQGYVTYPPGRQDAKDLPMVVFVHGGPETRDWWEYDKYVQAMATRGYAVLQVNFRGSAGYGYDFAKAGWHEWGGKMQDDVTDATRWAIAQGIADKDRICIYGGSYGGYAALEGAVKEPDLYRCAIGYVGVYDLPMMFKRGDIPQFLYSDAQLKRMLGTDMDELARRSPVNQLDSLKARVMLIVGGRDDRVPPAQGKELHEALKKRGIAHEWLYKADEGHGFYDPVNVAELFAKVDAFLDSSIGPGAQSAAPPAPTAQ